MFCDHPPLGIEPHLKSCGAAQLPCGAGSEAKWHREALLSQQHLLKALGLTLGIERPSRRDRHGHHAGHEVGTWGHLCVVLLRQS